MASSIKICTVDKCDMSSCALCHCCGKDLCLDHLKEHRDLLNAQLVPLAHQVNVLMENFNQFQTTSTPASQTIERWRQQAHQSIDNFCRKLHDRITTEKVKSQEQVQTIHTTLEQIIRKQGATRENISGVTKSLDDAQQQVNKLATIQINLKPLMVDENLIVSTEQIPPTNNSNRQERRRQPENTPSPTIQTNPMPSGDLAALINGSAFQIFFRFNDDSHTLVITRNDSILMVKRKIQDKCGVEPKHQCLRLMGKILQDQHSVVDVNIQKHSTLDLSVQTSTDKQNAPNA